MSYNLGFDCGELPFPHYTRGGTYVVGGTTDPSMNITYNYASYFCAVLGEEGVRGLYGKTADVIVPILQAAVEELGGPERTDYWDSTPGNAAAALYDLLFIALVVPHDTILKGD